ncbi:MAG TPA: UDP-glucose 6-dehydrogenase, partial [Usitatibacter sp.]|nr:UDP-glucose 6-dehydrogenase [Usitatibacter sp.]
MKVSIIGTGYVGLVTGACLAEVGNHVKCFDVDERKINMLREGDIPIFEPGLKEIVRNNAQAGRLSFTTDAKESAAYAKLQMIAVGTPPGEDGSA